MFEYIGSLFIVIFETFCCNLFFQSFVYRRDKLKEWQKITLFVVMVICFFASGLLLSSVQIIKLIVAIISISTIMFLTYQISIWRSVILAMLFLAMAWGIDYVVYVGNSHILSQAGDVKSKYEMQGVLLIVIDKMVLFMIILFIKRFFYRKKTEMLRDSEWLKFIVFPIFTIMVIAGMIAAFSDIDSPKQIGVAYMIAFGMIGMNLIVYVILNSVIDNAIEQHEKKVLEIQVKNQLNPYDSISKNYQRQKRISHEFKNHILCISALVDNHQYIDLENYINKMKNKIRSDEICIDTNHVIVNAILNEKYNEATEKGILFVVKVNDLKNLNIENEDLVVLLANLLNNAIEACEKCDSKKIIMFRFTVEDNETVLSVENSYNKKYLSYRGKEIVTNKRDIFDEHGVGIKNVVSIIDKYNGTYTIGCEDNKFYFSIVL